MKSIQERYGERQFPETEKIFEQQSSRIRGIFQKIIIFYFVLELIAKKD